MAEQIFQTIQQNAPIEPQELVDALVNMMDRDAVIEACQTLMMGGRVLLDPEGRLVPR